MAKKKQIIEESFKKMKSLLETKLHEAPVAAPAAQAQPAAQPAAAPDPKVQQASNAMDAEMNKAMKMAVGNIDTILAKFVATSGDKDGELDAPGEPQDGKQVVASSEQPVQGQ